jgi:hypothetical protein
MTKNTYIVGSHGTANYPNLTSIDDYVLTQGDNTFLVYPGTYDAPTNANWVDAAFIGVGDREEIVISGDTTIANTSSGTITFKNMTMSGSSAVYADAKSCITKLGAASTPLEFDNVVFNNAKHAVSHNGEPAFATTIIQVLMNLCDASATDESIVANSNVGISYSKLNTVANAYCTAGTGGNILSVNVLASTSGGSNAANAIETVQALIA